MNERIIESVTRQVNRYDLKGIDAIKALIACALDVTSVGGWSVDDYDYIITEVLYRLGKRERF